VIAQVMPLKCLSPDGPLYAFDFSREQFERLRIEHNERHHLRFGCCDSPVGLRVSSTGLPHFYHFRRVGSCRYETESELHLRIKQQVAIAAARAGWTAETEAQGREYGDGEEWIADVLATRRNVRVAFEVQVSGQTWADTLARQARYKASGVRGLWFFATRNYDTDAAVPAFQIRKIEDTQDFEVRISPPAPTSTAGVRAVKEEWLPLSEFVVGALSGRLHWAPAVREGNVDALVRAKSPISCSCGNLLSFPVGLVVSTTIPGHHSIVWALMSRGLKTAGPKWLNALAEYANGSQSHEVLLAFRERQDRYTFRYRCPACGAFHRDVLSPHPEKTLVFTGIPISALGPALPASPEWVFLNRWLLTSSETESLTAFAEHDCRQSQLPTHNAR
jgi:hypothetical protein